MSSPALTSMVLVRLLAEPRARVVESDRGRARLLAWLQLALLALAALGLPAVLLVNTIDADFRGRVATLVVGLMLPLLLAYGLNRAGYYPASAWLTVLAAFCAPWGSVLLIQSSQSGNFAPLIFTGLPVFLASVLISPAATAGLAAAQFGLLIALQLNFPNAITGDWPSLLIFAFFLSVLSVLAAVVSHQDRARIEQQAQWLAADAARLRELSVRDALTGLFNRRYLEETLERELSRAQRTQYPSGVMMLDIDYFKRFNDSYGHALGDRLLSDLGSLLRASVRREDVACRYGGEEFALVLPQASPQVLRDCAERIRAQAAGLSAHYAGQSVGPVTLSIGLACFPQDGATAEALLKAADDALYRAKRDGRDRVVAAS